MSVERRRRASAFLFAPVVLAWTMAAHAQAPSPEQEAIFRNGLDDFSRGNNAGAIAAWENLVGVLGAERGFKVLYNLGLAYQASGDVTRAIERFNAFLEQVSTRDPTGDLAERVRDATTRRDDLEHTHGAIRLAPPARGGLVLTRIEGGDPRAAGYVVWLPPGPHEVELFVGTDHMRQLTVDVEAGKTAEISTTPPDVPNPPVEVAPPTPAPRNPAPQSTATSTWIWVGAGATVASVALPLTTFFVASNDRDKASALGPGNSGYATANSHYETWRTAYYASYALPAALALATAAYAIFRPSPRVAGIGSLLLSGRF